MRSASTGASTDDVEVTLEANPTSVEATRFRGYRAAGVNRVSLGVQALDDASLKALGRLHSAREALDAVAIARAAFERYSFDLIYARPDQTPAMWADELKLAIGEAAEHLSLYQLTIEAGTPFFGLHAAGKLQTPDEATARALYDVTQEICAQHGLPAYEISNHARAGAAVPAQSRLLARRGICRHRPRRAWPPRHRRRAPRHRHREASGNLADARRGLGPRRRHRRHPQQRRARRRIPADGIAAGRRHRSRAAIRRCPAARSIRTGSRSCATKARSPSTPTAACA